MSQSKSLRSFENQIKSSSLLHMFILSTNRLFLMRFLQYFFNVSSDCHWFTHLSHIGFRTTIIDFRLSYHCHGCCCCTAKGSISQSYIGWKWNTSNLCLHKTHFVKYIVYNLKIWKFCQIWQNTNISVLYTIKRIYFPIYPFYPMYNDIIHGL